MSKEAADVCRSNLAHIAETIHKTTPEQNRFSLEKEHHKTIKELKTNPDLVITRPDKGKEVVVMKRQEYVAKMLKILEDRSKFEWIGSVTDCDRTARIETSLQDLLRSLHKAGEIGDTT